MDKEHLTATQLERYRQRRMNPAELLAADTHLERCGRCREAAGEAAGAATVESLRAELVSRESRPVHLAYGQLASFVDETLGDVEREIVESHLAVCGECKADWLDLDLFRKSLTAPPRPAAVRSPTRSGRGRARQFGLDFTWTPVRAAAAVAGVVILVWVGSIPFRKGAGGFGPQTAQLDATQPHVAAPRGTDARDTAGPVVALKDGGGTVALNPDGTITGLPAVSTDLSDAVKLVLGGRPLAVSGDAAGLVGRPGVLLGGDQPRNLFGPSSPVGTVVIADRPTLRWQPLAGARRYEVSVYDAGFTPVAVSPSLSGNEWTLPRSLPGGAIYSWQVKASKEGEEVLSPKPPEPEARFKVLDRRLAAELLRAQREQAGSHLALGVLLAGAGALDDAEREFKALADANPHSPVPQRLLRELGAARR